jgi:Peptidase_C39 like family
MPRALLRSGLAGGIASIAAVALLAPAGAALADGPTTDTKVPINFHRWTTYRDWRSGHSEGLVAVPGDRTGVVLARPVGTTDYTDPHTGVTKSWEYGTWLSPQYNLNFGATELVSSWNANTPAGTWLQVELHGTYSNGQSTPWYVMGRWASGDSDIMRTSVDGQQDAYSDISTDTFEISDPTATDVRLTGYQLKLTVYRTPGSHVVPRVWQVGAFASNVPARFDVPVSTPTKNKAVELPVPRYSQDVHAGQYPQYDNGGEAWCSPTSSEMVIEYWGHHPTAQQMSWVDPTYADPSVDQAARMTYDYQYEGAGNWPFNAGYASSYGLDAIVTQLHSLNEIEQLVRHGIPVVTSQSFLSSELDGAGYNTSGHLMVIIGFTKDGDVIANDPASPTDPAVRHVYKRHQFETVWLRTKRYRANGTIGGGSGGVVYLYKPHWMPLPPVLDRTSPNW